MSDDVRQHLLLARESSELALGHINAALEAMDGPVSPGDVISVGPSDNLLSVLEQAPAGATVAIDPAYNQTLQWWEITKPVTITSSVPFKGQRIAPDAVAPTITGFLTIACPDVNLSSVRLAGFHPDGTLVTVGERTTLDRMICMGSPDGQHRGVMANAAGVVLTRCHIGNIWKDQDTQAICGTTGTKNLRVDDCHLEASGENVLFGGDDNASESLTPQDILITNSYLFKPPEWRDKPGCTCKNLYELKAAFRAVLRGCKLENSWVGGQGGEAIVLTVRNQDGGSPWNSIDDCVIEDCNMLNIGAGVNILGRDYRFPSKVMTNLMLRRLMFENIDPWAFGGTGRQIFISGGPKNLSIEDCSFKGQHLNSFLSFDQPEHLLEGFVYRRNYAQEGEYGIVGTSAPSLGTAALEMYAPGYTWADVTIQKTAGYHIDYPEGTTLIGE